MVTEAIVGCLPQQVASARTGRPVGSFYKTSVLNNMDWGLECFHLVRMLPGAVLVKTLI